MRVWVWVKARVRDGEVRVRGVEAAATGRRRVEHRVEQVGASLAERERSVVEAEDGVGDRAMHCRRVGGLLEPCARAKGIAVRSGLRREAVTLGERQSGEKQRL